ncbi:metal-binding protein [Iocasia frigidifontis]|uniref:Metal-binding protein n=1 Tax=Iocasia fonsfrigidae TaxID=2682810 RepID=A0A8A7KFR6_9FIRM|nr:metal-binding protein [Iocasia fonsfrigidae]
MRKWLSVSENRYRSNKIKQEHTILSDIFPFLEEIAMMKTVKSIIPGRINRRKGSGIQAYLQLKYKTASGIKLLGKTSSSIQEVFVVTDNQDKTIENLKLKEFIK